MVEPLIPAGTPCKIDPCEEDADHILFASVKIFNIEKEIQVYLCKKHHTEAVGENVNKGFSIGYNQPEGKEDV